MANIDATQYASAMLNKLRTSKEKQSVKEVTSSAKKLPMVSRYYGTSTEMLKDMFSGTKNYNDTMFAEAAKRGEAQQYLALLAENEDVQLSDEFYDTAYYDYETNLGELSLSLVDDTDKTLVDRTTMVFDPTTGEYVEQNIGKMTDKQYLEYQLNQARQYRSQEIQFDLEKYRKESMTGWNKFVNSTGQVLAEFGEGVVGGVVNILDLVGALGYSIYQGVTHASGNVFENSFVEYYRNIGISSKYEPAIQATLGEWERKYGWIKNIDGSSTSVGGVLASIANSFGQMLPGIGIGALTGGASIPIMAGGKAVAKIPVGFATFYAQMYSGNMYENATNPALKDTPAGSLILNAGLKAVSQAVIEWGLGKILGGTVGNHLLGLGSRGLVQGTKAIAKGLTKGKIAGATIGFLLKSAGQEGLEEFLQDMGDMLIDTAFSLHNDGYTGGVDFQQLLDSFIVGAISSILLSGLSVGYQETASAITKGNNRFDIFYTKDGKTKKVRGFSRLLWREMLNEYDENIEAIRNGTLSEKATLKTMQGIYATYQTLGQFFDGISEERITKAMSLLNGYMNNQKVVNERFQRAQWLKENFGTKVDPDSLVDVDKLKEIRTQTMNEYVSQLSGDVSRVLVDAKITGVMQASVKKDVKAIIEKNKEKLVDNDVTEVVRAVDKNSETVGTNDQSSIVDAKMEKYRAQQKAADTEVEDLWKKSQKTVDELSKDYDWIFTTDGHVALEDGKYLFVPEAWLENYTPAEIKEFLIQADIINTLMTDEAYKPVYEAMVKSYKEFTGADLRKGDIRGAERVILDTLFNEAVFQHFLLSNFRLFDKANEKNILFTLAGLVQDLGKRYAKKYKNRNTLLDNVYEKIKETMRKPILKAVVNWRLDPQLSGADEVLTPRDMEFINGRKARDIVIKGPESSAYYHVRDEILAKNPNLPPFIKDIIDKGSQKNASKRDKIAAHLILDYLDQRIYDTEVDKIRSANNVGAMIKALSEMQFFLSKEKPNYRKIESLIKKVYWFSHDANVHTLIDETAKGLLKTINLATTQRQIDQNIIDNISQLISIYVKMQDVLLHSAHIFGKNVKNKHVFTIPVEAFSLTDPTYIQHYADVVNKFEETFGISPVDFCSDKLNLLKIPNFVSTINRLLPELDIADIYIRRQFVQDWLENRLGDGYIVYITESGIIPTKVLTTEQLFRPEVLEGNLAKFFKFSGKKTLDFTYGKGEARLTDLLSDYALQLIDKKNFDITIIIQNFWGEEGETNLYTDSTTGKIKGEIFLQSFDVMVLYHEILHAVQGIFGLPSGGNPSMIAGENSVQKEIFENFKDCINAVLYFDGQNGIPDTITSDDVIQDNIPDNLFNIINYLGYMLIEGEIWARAYGHNKTLAHGYTYLKNGDIISPLSGNLTARVPYWSYGKIYPTPTKLPKHRLQQSIKEIPTTSAPSETYQVNSVEEAFLKALEAHDARYMNENTNTNYHSAFTGRTSELLDDLLSDSLPITTRRLVSIDQIIRKPQDYLKKSILNKMSDKSEGGVYRFLQNYFFKQGYGYNIDIHKKTHQYIFVNDSAFADIVTPEMNEAIDADDDYDFVEAHTNKINKLSDFIDKKALQQLNIPVDIDVVISTNKDATNETQFNDKHKNGIIYLKTDDYTTNAELAMKIMHEFRHVLQHYNFLEGGFTNNFKVSPELLADVKKYYPGLFTNKIIRERFKTDEKIVQQFIYWQVSGEQNAFAFNPNILFGKPWFATHEAGKGVLYAPWYGKNANGKYEGIYQVDIANRMADETKTSTAKGHKLTERGTATSYKGKGKRVTIGSEVVGEPTVKTNRKTGKKTIIPNVRETVIYQYDKKGVYLSKKRATKIINGQTSNLQYFWKKGGDNQMSPDMQDFIEATTGHETMLPKGLVGAIRKGTLTKDELMAWFRSVDLKNDEAINDFTFDLLNEHIFKNSYLKSKDDLVRLVDLDIANWYAAYTVIKASGAKYDWLLRENTVEGFSNFVSTMADSSFKDDFEKAKKEFQHALKFEDGKYVPTEVDHQIRQYMRVATMLLFDGTLQNAMTLAGYFRTFTKHFADRALGRKVVSLDSAQNGQNKTAGHGGESEKGASLGDILDARKSTSGGAIRNPFSSTIEETYIENSDDVNPDEAIKSLAIVEYEQTFGESSNNNIERVIKALKSKKIDANEKKKLANKLNSLVKKTLDSIARKKKKALAEADFDFVSMLDESTYEETDISDTKQIDILYDNKSLDFQNALRDYITGKISADEMIDLFRDVMLENYSMKYADMSIEELNARYDAARMNQLLPDDMQIDITSSEKWSRRNTQQNIKTRVRQINQFVRKGEIVWETLPKDIQNMFEIKTIGKGRDKLEYYVLKEEYYVVDKSKKDENRFTQIKATYDALNTIYQLAKKGAFLKTEVAAEMRKNLAAIERSNRRKQREQAKTESKFIEIVYNYKKKTKTETAQKVKNAPVRTEVNVTVGSEIELPEKLNKLFATGFEGMADTEVQFASQDAEGKLYEKGDKEFESRLQHEIVSWDIFYEYNREILANLTRDDVIDIVEAIQKGIWAMGDLDAQRKVLAFQIFVLGFIYDGTRGNQNGWNLAPEEVESIRKTYEKLASVAGTGLNAVGQMISTVNPVKRVQQRLLEDWDIDPEQSQPLFDAITSFTNAENDDARITASNEVARQLGIIEGLMKQHQLRNKLDRKADKERQKALRDKWHGDLDQYKVAEARWKKLKAEGNDKQAGPRPQRPEKPKALRVNILDNPLYKGLMNWRYTAMLSNPATWVRNIVSDGMIKVVNKASDAVANVVFDIAKKGYRADQWDLSGRTKVSEDVNTFVDNLVNSIMYTSEELDKDGNVIRTEERRLFDLLYDGTSKYSDRMKLKTGADLFSALVVQAVEAKYAATHRFNIGALDRVANFVTDRIKDTRFIKSAANKYFKKILQIEVNNGKIDLSKPLSRETLDLFAEAVILASQDFMHKESALGTMMSSLREKHPNTYAVANLFFPFLNASFNWFTAGFKMSPFGLAKAIWNSAHLEKMITDIDERRAKGEVLPSTKAVQYLVRRDVGKGIIGTILWGLGAILAAVGWIRIEEEDDKPYVYIGDIKLDIGDIFGSSSLLVGAAIVGVASRDEATFDDVLGTTFNLLLDGFIGKDLWETSRWNNNMYEFMLRYTESFMKSFMPQMVQLIVRATNNYNITYSSGILGSIQRWLNSFVPTQPLGDKRVNPYTGELETKYAIPFLGEILKSGLFGIRIVWEDISAGEILAKEYGVNKNPIEAEITINGVKTSLGDKNQLNQYYGKLNANSLVEIQKERHLVEMPDGSFETLSWNQMTDDQRKNVIERTFTKNAKYAKVYMWTQVLNRKYYTNNETRRILRELGITSNVYLGDKGYVE